MRPPASAQLRGADWGAPSLWIQPSSSRFCHPVYCCCLVAESCPTLCDRMDCSPPGSSVRGILRARTLRGLPCPSPGDLPDPGADLCLERQQAGSSPVCQPAALTLCYTPHVFLSISKTSESPDYTKRTCGFRAPCVWGRPCPGRLCARTPSRVWALASGRLAGLSLQTQTACLWAPGTAGRGGRHRQQLTSRLFEL